MADGLNAASPVVALAAELIRRRSVTPDDAGCQALIAERLATAGFEAEWLNRGEVTNLLLTRGDGRPSLWFVGHTDVVPPGPDSQWTHPPFEPVIEDGMLWGRGAADMKGAVAAMVVAAERSAAADPSGGQLGILLTSDEEGPAADGIRYVAEVLKERGGAPDHCLVGEPSSKMRLGDQLRIGRRGSVHLHLNVPGVQGHTAFPEQLVNPVGRIAPFLVAIAGRHWDDGDEHFPPTHGQVSNLNAGTGAENVTPASVELRMNFRNGPATPFAALQQQVAALLAEHDLDDAEVTWHLSGEPFRSPPGALTDAVVATIEAQLGVSPDRNTGGGTSDGRFLAPLGAEVIEFGVSNATIHQIDERVACSDLEALADAYGAIANHVLGQAV